MPEQVVVIGASMGGIDALGVLLGGLPGTFPASVCVVLHTSPKSPNTLADILQRSTTLDVVRARDDDSLERGRVYVAPADCHLLVERERVCVTKGPKENQFRPAINPLFRSAARAFGSNAIGIVLTGLLDDGTSGLANIKRMGGVAVVQDPTDAQYPSMPLNALEHVEVDYSEPVAQIPHLLLELTRRPAPAPARVAVPAELETEVRSSPASIGFCSFAIRETVPVRAPSAMECLFSWTTAAALDFGATPAMRTRSTPCLPRSARTSKRHSGEPSGCSKRPRCFSRRADATCVRGTRRRLRAAADRPRTGGAPACAGRTTSHGVTRAAGRGRTEEACALIG